MILYNRVYFWLGEVKTRTQARRDAIISAAAQLFQEQGYERASMNELAKRLGGSKATLYGYFPSKEALFAVVVRTFATNHLVVATSELGSLEGGPDGLRAMLMRFGERMLEVLTNDASALAVSRMVIAESGRSDLGQVFHDSGPDEAMAALAKFLTEAMERGLLRRASSTLRAKQLLGLLTAEVNVRLYQRDPAPLSRAAIHLTVENAVEMFLAGAGGILTPPELSTAFGSTASL